MAWEQKGCIIAKDLFVLQRVELVCDDRNRTANPISKRGDARLINIPVRQIENVQMNSGTSVSATTSSLLATVTWAVKLGCGFETTIAYSLRSVLKAITAWDEGIVKVSGPVM